MTQTKNILFNRIICGLSVIAFLLMYFPNIAAAVSAITARSVAIGSSVASASTTYNFTFTAAQATAIKSVGFAACTTASGDCTPSTGFSSASSTLASSSNLGSGGSWTVNTSTATELRMNNTSNTGAPSAGITANFASVTNPSAANDVFFMRITTYSDDAWTTAIDTGVVATATAGQITVTASVGETLTFTLATATVALGTITTTTTGAGVSTMTLATNAPSGYSVAYNGTTLTSGENTIAAMASGGSDQGTAQFGINLKANATPIIGADTSGSGTGAPTADYNTADTFKFVASTTTPIATASLPTLSNVFTTSYIANVSAVTKSGAYSTAIMYIATANF